MRENQGKKYTPSLFLGTIPWDFQIFDSIRLAYLLKGRAKDIFIQGIDCFQKYGDQRIVPNYNIYIPYKP